MANTHGMTAAQVLAALYNASAPDERSPAWFQYVPGDLKDAEEILSRQTRFDYLRGRPIKVDLLGVEKGELDVSRYDMILGREGKGQEALDYFHERLQASGGKWPVGL